MDESKKGSRGAKLTKSGIYKSRVTASQNYEKKIKQITVRISAESKDKLDAYISNSKEYGSVNSMILDLLEKKTGINFKLNK